MPGRLCIYNDVNFKEDIYLQCGDYIDNIVTLKKQYNIAPTINIPVFLNTYVYTYGHFGLIPSWAKNKKSININARSETIYEKVTFRESFKNQRCIIPINGFYEWKKDNDSSIPYLIKSKNKNYLALAGIYSYYYDLEQNENILSIALITIQPNEIVEKIHDRMPVILDIKDWSAYLNTKTSLSDVNKLFKSCDSSLLSLQEVSSYVNKVSNQGIECLDKDIKIKKEEKEIYKQLSLF